MSEGIVNHKNLRIGVVELGQVWAAACFADYGNEKHIVHEIGHGRYKTKEEALYEATAWSDNEKIPMVVKAMESLSEGIENGSMIDEMVNRFVAWPLPESVCSDVCATKRGYPHRSGTNLLSAAEARQMFEYVLGSKWTSQPQPTPNAILEARIEELQKLEREYLDLRNIRTMQEIIRSHLVELRAEQRGKENAK